MDEPARLGARVRDRDGDIWRKGRTRWTCETRPDGHRVQQVGRLPWYGLELRYGPLIVVDLNDRKAAGK